MANPLILSTWSFGMRANAAAWSALSAGGSALDAVETACRDAESDLDNHTVGKGGYPDRDGQVSLDSAIMLSPSRRGAVAGIRRFVHPVSIARSVMERTSNVLLVGSGAEAFATEQGFAPEELLTDYAASAWTQWRRNGSMPKRNIEERGGKQNSHDTIGVLAIDAAGTLAGACSTSGLAFKLPGRVGDSPIIGHGLYVDPAAGAAVATGHGELVMGVCGTFLAVEMLRRRATPLEAATEVLVRIQSSYDLVPDDQVGIIVMDKVGTWSSASLRPGFRVAVRSITRDELTAPEHILIP